MISLFEKMMNVELRVLSISLDVGECRLMTGVLFQKKNATMNELLSQISCPMLLLWGDLDPWMGPSKCDQIKRLYPKASMVRLQAGHCPHDEVPEQVNGALLNFMKSVN